MRPIHWLALAASVALAGCGEKAPELAVERVLVRLSPNPAAPSVAYFTVKGGAVDDRLINVSSPVVVRTEMHESMMNGAMMTMKPIEGGVPIPANGTVKFEEGGKHVMLFDVNGAVKPDTTMRFVFTFASGRKMEGQASVRAPGQVL